MQQLLPVAAVLAVVLWLLGRPRPRLLPSDDGSAIAALNRAQIALLRSEPAGISPDTSAPDPSAVASALPAKPIAGHGAGSPPWPDGPRQRRHLLSRLEASCRGDAAERIAAMQACVDWGGRAVLPLLRRGLKDPDARVVALAARGLAAFRGRPSPLPVQAMPLPRNVARTR